eukprot:PITA_26144
MLFGHPLVQEARKLKALLDDFSAAFGASINTVESQIFFLHTTTATQSSIICILGFSLVTLPSKYLGAPLIDWALKHSSWQLLLDKLESRLTSWTFRALNMVSRVILIESILQSMPLYLFSILAMPKWILKKIKNLQRNFLWGSMGQDRKWALVKWGTTYLPKNLGGISLRDPQHSNIVMGARMSWKWLSSPNTHWAILWRVNLISPPPTEEEEAHSWEIVNQYWLPTLDQGYRQWRKEKDIIMNGTEAMHRELNTELTNRWMRYSEEKEILHWVYKPRGTFTTQEAYNLIINSPANKDPLWDKVWHPKIWPKISTFLWLLCHKRIIT